MSVVDPSLIRSAGAFGEPVVRHGMQLVDEYLEYLQGRCRPNTLLAASHDLKVFCGVDVKPADAVRPADVLGFITAKRPALPHLVMVQPVASTRQPLGLPPTLVD